MSLSIPRRVLMGPGPSLVSQPVMNARAAPVLGHLDPDFIVVMNEIQVLLRKTFQTNNEFTVLVAGTGMSGMEAAFVNLLERGERVLICVNGYFSGRMSGIAARAGAKVDVLERPWGSAFTPEDIAAALKKHKNTAVVAIVHAETSTGVLQPMEGIADVVHNAGALLIMDCVLSLGGVNVAVDEWRVDAAYSGSQKCLAAPPGLAPFTLSAHAMEKIRNRKTPVQSYYFDALELEKFWLGEKRAYHTAAPAPLFYALLEALHRVHAEGLPERFARHALHGGAMHAAMSALGFPPIGDEKYLVPHLCAVQLPPGVDDAAVRNDLLKLYNHEISGGLGEYAGKMWRIGTMGEGADKGKVMGLINSIESALGKNHVPIMPIAGTKAATKYYEMNEQAGG